MTATERICLWIDDRAECVGNRPVPLTGYGASGGIQTRAGLRCNGRQGQPSDHRMKRSMR